MKKYIVFKNRAEVKPGTPVGKMEDALIEGDPHEIERFDSWDDAKDYLRMNPGCYWTEAAFSGRVQIAEGRYAVECEIDDDGEISSQFDMEFADLKER